MALRFVGLGSEGVTAARWTSWPDCLLTSAVMAGFETVFVTCTRVATTASAVLGAATTSSKIPSAAPPIPVNSFVLNCILSSIFIAKFENSDGDQSQSEQSGAARLRGGGQTRTTGVI